MMNTVILKRPKGKEVRKEAESRKLKNSNEDVNKPEAASEQPKLLVRNKDNADTTAD